VLRRSGILGNSRELANWIVPTLGIVALPKCPACIAAYIALATGIGISIPAAAYLRLAILVACIAALSYLATRRLRAMLAHASASRAALIPIRRD
jgi:hypothetical protein